MSEESPSAIAKYPLFACGYVVVFAAALILPYILFLPQRALAEHGFPFAMLMFTGGFVFPLVFPAGCTLAIAKRSVDASWRYPIVSTFFWALILSTASSIAVISILWFVLVYNIPGFAGAIAHWIGGDGWGGLLLLVLVGSSGLSGLLLSWLFALIAISRRSSQGVVIAALICLGLLLVIPVPFLVRYTQMSRKIVEDERLTHSNDREACANIEGNSQNFCWQFRAIRYKDTSFCDRTSNVGWKKGCLDEVYIRSDNPSDCERHSNPSFCYYTHATRTRNVELCEHIPLGEATQWHTRESCYQYFGSQ